MKKNVSPQVRANRRWAKKNPERARYLKSRTSARTFARHYAKKEDMEELLHIFKTENSNYGDNYEDK